VLNSNIEDAQNIPALKDSENEPDNKSFIQRIFGKSNVGDFIFEKLTLLFAVLVLLLVVLMAYQMYVNSQLSISKFGWHFLFSSTWDPVTEVYGALPVIYGTVVSSILALLIAVPLGIGVAVFLSEIAPGWLEKPLSFLTELLAGIPSVVYGLWGIFVLVPWLRDSIEPYLSDHFGKLPFFSGRALWVWNACCRINSFCYGASYNLLYFERYPPVCPVYFKRSRIWNWCHEVGSD